MKKSRSFKLYAYAIIFLMWLLATFAACLMSISAHERAENYRKAVAEQYGVKTVHFRERTTEYPLWFGEPYGAYVYVGYVGEYMTERDAAAVRVLASGQEAEKMITEFLKRRDSGSGWFVIALLTTFAACLFLALAWGTKEEEERSKKGLKGLAPKGNPADPITSIEKEEDDYYRYSTKKPFSYVCEDDDTVSW